MDSSIAELQKPVDTFVAKIGAGESMSDNSFNPPVIAALHKELAAAGLTAFNTEAELLQLLFVLAYPSCLSSHAHDDRQAVYKIKENLATVIADIAAGKPAPPPFSDGPRLQTKCKCWKCDPSQYFF